VDARKLESVWTTPGFDHCMFDALPGFEHVEEFQRAIFAMKWDDPRHRRVLELEGLKQWMPPRPGDEGYHSLIEALDAQKGW
jgi:hypothetical protein